MVRRNLLSAMDTLNRHDFDAFPYADALALQFSLRQQTIDGGPGALLLMTHPPTVTLGRHGKWQNLPDADALRAAGTVVARVDRGGDVTWHGPGQLVGYPIVDLNKLKLGVHDYVCALAEALGDVLRDLGIEAAWEAETPGLWVGNDKIAAFGVHVHRGVTTHGFSLNVDCDLSAFDAIIPCGLSGRGVTSILALSGDAPPMPELRDRVANAVAAKLGVRIAGPSAASHR